MNRKCDRCGRKMSPQMPRRRVGGLFVCDGCESLSPHWKHHGQDGFAKNAHDMSNDPMVITHCPMCGSGQVIARSDGSTECEFCDKVFTVKMEPYYPSWPQTIDGMPQDVPLSPNEDPMLEGEGPVPDEEGLMAPDDLGDEEEEEPEEDDGEEMPPFKSSLRTYLGDELPEDAYLRHLAINYAADRDRMINVISDDN